MIFSKENFVTRYSLGIEIYLKLKEIFEIYQDYIKPEDYSWKFGCSGIGHIFSKIKEKIDITPYTEFTNKEYDITFEFRIITVPKLGFIELNSSHGLTIFNDEISKQRIYFDNFFITVKSDGEFHLMNQNVNHDTLMIRNKEIELDEYFPKNIHEWTNEHYIMLRMIL